jgi:hypothetical protein
MATFTFFHEWKSTIATTANLSTDVFKLYLSNDAPVVATDTVKADVTEITNENGYATFTLTPSWVETGAGTGVWRFKNDADKTFTASGGSFGPFQYVVIFDDTLTSPGTDPVCGYWDVGSGTTITTGNSFLIDLDSNFAIWELS